MSAIWYVLIGFVLGQFTAVLAGWLGEICKDRREALEENELHRSYAEDAVKELERFRNELH